MLRKLLISLSLPFTIQAQINSVEIYGINKFQNSDFVSTTMILKKLYNFQICTALRTIEVSISENIESTELNNKINGSQNFSFDKNKPIKIYLTKSNLMLNGQKVCGVSFGNSIYINTKMKFRLKTTLVHEISHSLGLKHCENICIMNVKYNPNKLSKIWDNKNDRPIFCKSCEKQLYRK